VVLMSGFSEADVLQRCAGEKPAGFLAKPFTSGELLRAVRQALPHRSG
jgi:hypothetical protein